MKNHCRNIKPINVVKTSIIVSIMRKYLYMKRIAKGSSVISMFRIIYNIIIASFMNYSQIGQNGFRFNVNINVFSEMAVNKGIYFGMIAIIIRSRLADGSMLCNLIIEINLCCCS